MFTGLIEEIGKVLKIKKNDKSLKIKILCNKILEDISLGDSIAVNGVCLTVTEYGKEYFVVDAIESTVKKTNLYTLRKNSIVNLERAMSMNSRFGGHIVQGHVDSIAILKKTRKESNSIVLGLEVKEEISKKIIDRGSITINGISLTVSFIEESYFEVSIIPQTFKETNLKYLSMGEYINIELDIIGKYIEKYMFSHDKKELTMDFLIENGF